MSKTITITLTADQATQVANTLGLVSFLMHGIEANKNQAVELMEFYKGLKSYPIDHNELYKVANTLGFDCIAKES